ncbi:MAG: hypothetical protein SPD11_07990 [Sphaerochaetaceae bacterium]|nr:hypothetical protein [Sphaerochaetaceae bacterium]
MLSVFRPVAQSAATPYPCVVFLRRVVGHGAGVVSIRFLDVLPACELHHAG